MSLMLPVVLTLLSSPALADDPEPSGQMLRKITSREGCQVTADKVTFVDQERKNRVNYTSWEVTGCDDETFILTWAAAMGQWLYYDDQDLRDKAPFDLNCPAEEVTYVFLNETTRGVTGCDRRMTYVFVADSWVANVTQN